VPTDFEYVGIKSELGRGWHLDDKWYTYSYYNQQNYSNASSKVTVINDKTCATASLPCGVDKLNSYRKYGNILTLSQTSEYGVFRTGMWYEWATTNRYQYPSDPRTWKDATLPNFHERFWTNSYQPYAEYEYHFDQNVSMTAGLKLAHYTQYLKQYADNGKTVGSLNGAPFVTHAVGYTSYMPSFDMNYRIKSNWSAYGQFATGSVIPPSSVFDVKNASVLTLPKPQN
jgi:iron complex outermembrane receptor protein